MTWAEEKIKALERKGRKNWDIDDIEAWCYCQECFAEDIADLTYMDHYMVIE